MNIVKNNITKRIKHNKRGWVFCAKDFCDLSTTRSISKTLHRMVKDDFIIRIDRGLYYYPVIHKNFGIIRPSADNIATAIARMLKIDISPSGQYCLNILGLSNQVQAQNVYLTTGRSFVKKICDQVIQFKHTNLKLPSKIPTKLILVLHALNFLGKKRVDDVVLKKFSRILTRKDRNDLLSFSNQLSSGMVDIIHKLKLNTTQNEKIPKTKPQRQT